MKLTIEENREAIKRYRHIPPVPPWGPPRCSARCPGTARNCTLRKGHAGPHVAHGTFKRVVAVWDKGTKALQPEKKRKRISVSAAPNRPRGGGLIPAVRAILRRLIPSPHAIEATFLLVLTLSMVWFAIDVALRILGVK
jgi:hypothetical protein